MGHPDKVVKERSIRSVRTKFVHRYSRLRACCTARKSRADGLNSVPLRSRTVMRTAVNRDLAGSIPAGGAKHRFRD